jgi:hypothetical protein
MQVLQRLQLHYQLLLFGGYKVIKKMDSSANSVLIQGVGGINIDGSSSLVVTGQYSKSSVGADAKIYNFINMKK